MINTIKVFKGGLDEIEGSVNAQRSRIHLIRTKTQEKKKGEKRKEKKKKEV